MILYELWLALAILHDTVFWAVITNPSESAFKIKRLVAIIPVLARPSVGAFLKLRMKSYPFTSSNLEPREKLMCGSSGKSRKSVDWTVRVGFGHQLYTTSPPSLPQLSLSSFWDRDDNNSYPKMSWWSWNHMRSLIGNRTHHAISSVLRTITCIILFNP